MKNPFLFACGVPRSGTTLLQRMLDHHPELTVTNDSHFIPRALELTDNSLVAQAEAGSPIPLTLEIADNVRNYHRFSRIGIDDDEFESVQRGCDTYQQLVSGLYDLSAQKSNKRFAGEKTPDYVRRLPLLHGLFPAAKLIHIVRDGRDVALSLLDWATPLKGPARLRRRKNGQDPAEPAQSRIPLWNEHPVAVCALWWKWLAIQSRAQPLAPDSYMEIRYENLARDPKTSLNRVCNFLGLEFSGQMLDYHRSKPHGKKHNVSAKNAWLAPQTGLRNWRTDMEPEKVELFELLAADALQTFGYELQNRASSRKTIETVKHCCQWWQENFLAKEERERNDSEQGNNMNYSPS